MVAIITCFSQLLGIKLRNCSQLWRRGSRWQYRGPGRKPGLTLRGQHALCFFSRAHVFFFRGSSDILLTAPAASISAKSVVRIVFGEGASLVTWVRNVKSTRSLKKQKNNPNIWCRKMIARVKVKQTRPPWGNCFAWLNNYFFSSSFYTAKFHIWYVVFKIKTRWTRYTSPTR